MDGQTEGASHLSRVHCVSKFWELMCRLSRGCRGGARKAVPKGLAPPRALRAGAALLQRERPGTTAPQGGRQVPPGTPRWRCHRRPQVDVALNTCGPLPTQ